MPTKYKKMSREEQELFRDNIVLAVKHGHETTKKLKKFLKTKRSQEDIRYHALELVKDGKLLNLQEKPRCKLYFAIPSSTTKVNFQKVNKPTPSRKEAYAIVEADVRARAEVLQVQLDGMLEFLKLLPSLQG